MLNPIIQCPKCNEITVREPNSTAEPVPVYHHGCRITVRDDKSEDYYLPLGAVVPLGYTEL